MINIKLKIERFKQSISDVNTVMLILGMVLNVYLYKWYMEVDDIPGEFNSLELKIAYCMLLTISIFIFKPKQQHQKIVEKIIDYLDEKVNIQNMQIHR